jgi:hypothetical protein
LALAAWSRYLATTPAEQRAPDSRGERAVALATAALQDPSVFLKLDAVVTEALRESTLFREAFVAASRDLAVHGPMGAIERAVHE